MCICMCYGCACACACTRASVYICLCAYVYILHVCMRAHVCMLCVHVHVLATIFCACSLALIKLHSIYRSLEQLQATSTHPHVPATVGTRGPSIASKLELGKQPSCNTCKHISGAHNQAFDFINTQGCRQDCWHWQDTPDQTSATVPVWTPHWDAPHTPCIGSASQSHGADK